MPFADQVEVKNIPREKASDIYQSHHSYMDGELHTANFAHHGIYFQGSLTGAITYRYPLISKKRLHFDTDGRILPEPLSESDFSKLPEPLEGRAKKLIDQISESEVADSRIVTGDQIVSANRICLGVKMPNLASAGLARSQEEFFRSCDCPDEVNYLITFVKSNYSGSMIRALRDKGWRCVGWAPPSQASNREEKDVRDAFKWVFVCPIERIVKQCSLLDFS
jgi:hypothetical protein